MSGYKLKSGILKCPRVFAMCVWNDWVVTVSYIKPVISEKTEINVWTQNGHLLYSKKYRSSVCKMVPWDDVFVVAAGILEYWKLESVQDDKLEIKVLKQISKENVRDAIEFSDMLVTRHGMNDWQSKYKIWDKEGNCLGQKNLHGACWMVLFGTLWSLDLRAEPWFQGHTWRSSIGEFVSVTRWRIGFEPHNMCKWGDNRIAAGEIHGRHVVVFDWYGKVLFEFHTEQIPVYLTEWKDKLACVSANLIKPMPVLWIWNQDGSLFKKIPLKDNPQKFEGCILGYKDKLWISNEANIRIWTLLPVDWNVERLVWIGHMKNAKEDCLFAAIPKEIVKLVIYFLFQ